MAKKSKNLLRTYKLYTIIPAVTIGAVLLATILLGSLYAVTGHIAFIISFEVIVSLTLASYFVFYFRISKKLKVTYYQQLFETTYENINKIKNNDANLETYGDSDIKEIQMLDKATRDIKAKLESAYLVVRTSSYDQINLDYIDKNKGVVKFQSFKENIANIIFVSQSFRNVLIQVFFDLVEGVTIPKKEQTRLLKIYQDAFKEHENVLYMFADDEQSMYIYIPTIDSFTEIKEKLNHVVTSSSIMVRDSSGIKNVLARYAIVAYPYSNEDMIFGDLEYARSQNKPYNLYLPNRYKNNVGTKLLMNTTMSLNYASKIITSLSNLDYSAKNNEKNDALLNSVFDAIANFLDVDEAGIITYNETMNNYQPYVSSKRSSMFKEHPISNEFVEALASIDSEEDVYYFSMRKHASISLQQMLALYGIDGGIYYVVRDFEENKVKAVIYLFNRKKELILNTYLRETFLIVALRIENYFEKREISDYADMKDTENQNILALANMFAYHVDDDFNITYLSKGIKRIFPGIKPGEKCYAAMFGLDKRCKDCPLATKKKKYFEHHRHQYEVSTTLANRKDDDNVILLKHIQSIDNSGDLFQEDFLIYSFKALVEAVKNEYESNGRGYTLLLSIDNYQEIIEKIGPEGYNYLMRDYVRNLKNKLLIDDVYYYNPTTLAVHMPSVGHKDMITRIENIYPLSKQNYYDNSDFHKLNITYLPCSYPRGFAYAEDFLKHMSDFYRAPTYERNKDFIYFADVDIQRSASKRAFMVSVLETEFSGHNSTSMNLQPIVRAQDGHIFGAEILLRIADAHRNVFFNAQEISQIAEQENKTGLITESIINFIGTMYKEYGNNIFKINKFNRIAINIDHTYLDNEELLTKLISLCEENHLPAGFISLEIPEEMIPENKEKIKKLATTLSKYKIMFSCDRYLGQYVSIDELAFLGFKEAKIARDIILKIDTDQLKYDSLKEIASQAKKNGIGLAAVGVENAQQLKLLRDLDEEMMVQGYYLYKPLTRADLITALISYKS